MVPLSTVEEALHRFYIGAPGARLRKEDRKKAIEVAGLLLEVERILARSKPGGLQIVDAAAGKAYVGLLTAELLLPRMGRVAAITLVEREPKRAELIRRAIAEIPSLCAWPTSFTVLESEVADAVVWPQEADLVVALHACGAASDDIIDKVTSTRARNLLLVPCCTSDRVRASATASRKADDLGIPRHAAVRRRFIEAIVDAQRTLRLEATGYETTVVPFVPPTVTPHNLLWRARRVAEPARMAEAARHLARLDG